MNSYTARLQLDTRAGDLAHIRQAVADYTALPVTVDLTLHGRPDVELTLPAETLTSAALTAVAVVEKATGYDVMHLEVAGAKDWADRGDPPVPDMLSVTETADLLEVTRARVQQLIDGGQLAAVKIGTTWAVLRTSAEARAAAAGR